MSFHPAVYGKYFLLDRIAVGGMAEVFKAKTFGVRGFERLLVIKRILPHLSKDEEFVEMFIDEAKIAVELSHANICQVTDLGKIGDNYFIAMEFINGKDLRGILKKCYTAKTPLSVPQALYVAIEMLKGLEHAHEKSDTVSGKPLNLIHRDISPQNIMISYHAEVKIVDFGIAKTEFKLHRTQAGVLKGKFGYMSPEQAAGLELDRRTDVFSAGILLYEMLTGRRLFLGENDFETLEAIKECSVPPPSKYQPEITPELEEVVLKALAKERDDRFASAQEMQVALSKIFYATYPDFTTKDLSEFLATLFAAEIEQEQELLRRALDSIPPDQLAAMTSSGETRGGPGSQPSTVRAPTPPTSGISRPSFSPPSRKFQMPSAPPPIGAPVRVTLRQKSGPSFFRAFFTFLFAVALVGGGWIYFHPQKNPLRAPPSPTAEPSVTDEIKLSSSPKALLFVDGMQKGETPLSLPLARKKTYQIRLEKEGFKPLTEQLLVTGDQTQYSFKLEKDIPPIGSLYIESDPPGARISYDQTKTKETTPATIENLSLNVEHLITLEKEGFRRTKQTVVLKQPEERIDIAMERKPMTTLKINVTPRTATVYLDGKEHGQVIEDLEIGKSYKLTLSSPGYESETREIKATRAKMELDIELKKVVVPMGTVSLSANPWATILIDGKKIGDTPIMNQELPVGSHDVIFRHPDFRDVEKQIQIKKGENPPVIIDFKSGG
ncbi:MAG: serine/threonine-protein kinase [Pseudomonadota bacterium]